MDNTPGVFLELVGLKRRECVQRPRDTTKGQRRIIRLCEMPTDAVAKRDLERSKKQQSTLILILEEPFQEAWPNESVWGHLEMRFLKNNML